MKEGQSLLTLAEWRGREKGGKNMLGINTLS